MNLKEKNGYKLSCILTFFFQVSGLRLLIVYRLFFPSVDHHQCCLISSSFVSLFHLISVCFFPPQLSGPGSAGGQRHHQLQATSYPAAGYPCQPVWLSHREGRGKDKGDQRGEQAELKSTPSSLRSLRRRVQR